MHAVILVAATENEGRRWQRRRPDLGITHVITPRTFRDGMRPRAVYFAPVEFGTDLAPFERIRRALEWALLFSGRGHDDMHFLTASDWRTPDEIRRLARRFVELHVPASMRLSLDEPEVSE